MLQGIICKYFTLQPFLKSFWLFPQNRIFCSNSMPLFMLCLWSFGQIIESKWSQTGNLTWATKMAHKSWESWETKWCIPYQGIWKTDNMKFFYKIFPWWGRSLRNQQYECQQMFNTFNYIIYVCVYTCCFKILKTLRTW